MYSVRRIRLFNIVALIRIANILYKCGKEMKEKYGLNHWNNFRIKTWIIVALCALKNKIYLVYDGKTPVATFQTKKINTSFFFEKLATLPNFSGHGIGSFCLAEIERLGKENECKEIICDVYDKSEHAKAFYFNRGYSIYATTETSKYNVLKLRKEL